MKKLLAFTRVNAQPVKTEEEYARIGRLLCIVYERELKMFREWTPHYAHLENPSFDFGSNLVYAVIKGWDV